MEAQFTVGVISPGLVILGSIRWASREQQDAKYHSAMASDYQLLFPRFYLQVPPWAAAWLPSVMNCDNRSVRKTRSFLSRLLLVMVFHHSPSDSNWSMQVPATACRFTAEPYQRHLAENPSSPVSKPDAHFPGSSTFGCVLTISLSHSESPFQTCSNTDTSKDVLRWERSIREELELSGSFTTSVPGGSRLSLGEQPSRRISMHIISPAVENAFQFAPVQDALWAT